MAEKFFAEMVTRSERDRASARLEISFCDKHGQAQTLSLSGEALAGLAAVLTEYASGEADTRKHLTKIPRHYAVGHGRHEPFVMLRFEDEPAYGLSATQAADLAEALLEEAEAVSDAPYAGHQ